MTPPRVLHVFKYFRPRFTGEGIFVERLAPVFAHLRPDVLHEILVTATPRPAVPPSPPGLAKVHYLARSEAGASQRDLAAWLARNGRDYSVVHHHTHVDRTFIGALWLKLQGRRQVLSATLDDSITGLLATYRPIFRPLVRRLFGLIDRFVAISPKLFEQNTRVMPGHRCALVSIGIPLPAPADGERGVQRRALAIAADQTMLVSVGGICERKDQLFLVHQLPALVREDPTILLVLVGPVLEPAYHARIEAYVAEHGLQRHVRFAGYAEQPRDFYKAADLFVFASRDEGFGTVMIEAMAHGLPVVARHLRGVNDSYIDHGRSGFLFTDDADFQSCVIDLLHDEGLRRQIGHNARSHVAANFDIVDVAARYLALYGYPVDGAP